MVRIGAIPAGGLHVGTTHLAIGLRMRAGVLRDGAAPGGNLGDPGMGGLVTAILAARVRYAGAGLERVAGRGFTGANAVPALDVGIGDGLAMASSSDRFAGGAWAFSTAAPVPVSGQRRVVSAPGDAIASQVVSPHLGAATTVTFPDLAPVVVATEAGPTVIFDTARY